MEMAALVVSMQGSSVTELMLLVCWLCDVQPQQGMKEALTPILHCLSQICRANRSIRKFCRIRVIIQHQHSLLWLTLI